MVKNFAKKNFKNCDVDLNEFTNILKLMKMPTNVDKEIKFLDFCKVLDDVCSTPKHAFKYQKLQQFYKRYRKKCEEIKIVDPLADASFYPLLRLLLPQLERERPAYGLNKFGLRKILARIISLTKDSDGFKKLGSEQYDFADTAYNLLRKQFHKSKNSSIFDINECLDMFAKKHQDNTVCKFLISSYLFYFYSYYSTSRESTLKVISRNITRRTKVDNSNYIEKNEFGFK